MIAHIILVLVALAFAWSMAVHYTGACRLSFLFTWLIYTSLAPALRAGGWST